MRARTLALIAATAALLSACGAPSAALLPAVEPEGEVVAYYSPDAPALMLADTDPQSEGVRALAAAVVRAGALERLRAAAGRHGLTFAQVRGLLGGELAVGIPSPGAAPLVALAAEDAGALRALADSRVAESLATAAGSYRGASLYSGSGHAFAVRGRVLLVSRATSDLRTALDRRAGDDTFKGGDLDHAVPEVRGDALARALVDVGGGVGARGRTVPWLAALETLGLTLRAGEEGARIDFSLASEGEALLEVDVPVSPGERAPLAVTAGAPSVAVRDLAHVAGVTERAARAAFPLAVLRLDRARRALRTRAKVDLHRDVISRLHGPATFVRARNAVLLRADPSRPAAIRSALRRAAPALPHALRRAGHEGFSVRDRDGLHELRRGGKVVARLGMVGDVLVAGTGSPRALRALARAPLARPAGAKGALTVAVPRDAAARLTADRLGLPLPWRLDGWARGAREGLRGAVHVAW